MTTEVRYNDAPFSTSTTSNWVAKHGGLPPYVRAVARGIRRNGHSLSEAIQMAIGVMSNWIASPHTKPETKAKATAALAWWEKMKAAAHAERSGEPTMAAIIDSLILADPELRAEAGEIELRDLSEWSSAGPPGASSAGMDPSGAANLLPVGPSKKQSDEITHRFKGADLTKCAECGKPILDPVHSRHKPGQPIAPVPREVRHAGPDHLKVSSGHLAGHVSRARAQNERHMASVEGPLTEALKSHFADQRRITINRLLSKNNGKRLLKRAAAELASRDWKEWDAEHWYHGTYENLGDGTVLRPGAELGRRNFGDARGANNHHVFLTKDIDSAFTWGKQAAKGKKVYVYEVRPHQQPTQGEFRDWRTSAATIRGLVSGSTDPSKVKRPPPLTRAEGDEPIPPDSPYVIPPDPASGAPASVNPAMIFLPSYWADKTAEVLTPHLSTATVLAAGAVKHQVGVHDADTSLGPLQDLVAQRANAMAQYITGVTSKDLSEALSQGVANGEGMPEIAKRVNDVFDHADIARAKTIAQTAVVGAYNEGATQYAQSLPEGTVGGKRWISHRDQRTRLTHRLADGQEQPLDQPYWVGGAPMMHPGDQSAPISEWINCRCNQVFLPPGLAHSTIADAAAAYVAGLKATPPKPVSPYVTV